MSTCECFVGVSMALFMGVALFLRLVQKGVEKSVMESQMDERFSSRFGRSHEWFHEEVLAQGRNSDVIIVGAGVGGSALAYALAKDGRRVHVIERDLREPNTVVGEGLQPGGYLKLAELGLKDCVSNIDAQKVVGYVIYKKGRYVRLPYPPRSDSLTGKTFHHGRFVQRLRKKAASLPNVVLEQGTVTRLIKEHGTVKGVEYKTSTAQQAKAYASLTIVCDGYFSNLRHSLCRAQAKLSSHIVGWVMGDYPLPYADHAHVMASNSPSLIYRISSTETRCFINIPGEKLPSISNGDLSRYVQNKIAPHVDPSLRSAIMSTINEAKIRSIPYYDIKTRPYKVPGAFLIGDAFSSRYPLSAGGMTVALSDVVVMRDLLRTTKDLKRQSEVRNHLQSFYTLREQMAATIDTMAAYLDKLLTYLPNQSSEEVQDVFIECCKNETCAGMIATLSGGLNVQPLYWLLFIICILTSTIRYMFLPFPTPRRIRAGANFIWTLAGISISTTNALRLTKQALPSPHVG